MILYPAFSFHEKVMLVTQLLENARSTAAHCQPLQNG